MKTPLSAVLNKLSDFVIESDANGIKYEYSDDDFMNAIHVFNSILGTRMFEKIKDFPESVAIYKAEKMGEELHQLILNNTDFNTKDFYK